jgi:hypothetical protein
MLLAITHPKRYHTTAVRTRDIAHPVLAQKQHTQHSAAHAQHLVTTALMLTSCSMNMVRAST